MMKLIFLTILALYNLSFAQAKITMNFSKSDSTIIIKEVKLDSSFSQIKFFENNFFCYKKNKITSLDFSGNEIWQHELIDSINSNFIIEENKIVFLDSNNDLICLDMKTGKVMQSLGIDVEGKAFLVSFDYMGNNELIIPKETDSKKAILLFFDNGKLLCLDLETLQEYWRKDFQDVFVTNPTIFNNKIIVGMKSGFVNLIDANNGILLWKWKEKETFELSKTIFYSDTKSVYFLDGDGFLFSLNLLLGKLNWKIEQNKFISLQMISDETKFLIAQKENFNIVQIDLASGKILKEIKLDKSIQKKISYAFRRNAKLFLIAENKILMQTKNTFIEYYSNKNLIVEYVISTDNKFFIKDSQNNFIELQLR